MSYFHDKDACSHASCFNYSLMSDLFHYHSNTACTRGSLKNARAKENEFEARVPLIAHENASAWLPSKTIFMPRDYSLFSSAYFGFKEGKERKKGEGN